MINKGYQKENRFCTTQETETHFGDIMFLINANVKKCLEFSHVLKITLGDATNERPTPCEMKKKEKLRKYLRYFIENKIKQRQQASMKSATKYCFVIQFRNRNALLLKDIRVFLIKNINKT